MNYSVRENCRLCGSGRLPTVVVLSSTPPANEFVKPDSGEQECFPLYLVQCRDCHHVQLPVVVDPERLFRNYVYVSGTSPAFVEHFRKYAEVVKEQVGLRAGDLVVEIGSNDGTLLKQFQRMMMCVIGVDPATEIAKKALQDGVETWPEFFSCDTAARIESKIGKAKLVVANNVFAHADNLEEIVVGIKNLLTDDGKFVFEVQYLVSMLKGTLFDMIYHEHTSYHHLAPLAQLFQRFGMTLEDVSEQPTHGGSIRCTVSKGYNATSQAVQIMLIDELSFFSENPFPDFCRRISEAHAKLGDSILGHLGRGHTIVGYGAPAKLTTLMYRFGLSSKEIKFVIDDSPWKQGLVTPGTHIPVVSAAQLDEIRPDAIVVFAWNFAEQIIPKIKDKTSHIIVPLPEFKEIAT